MKRVFIGMMWALGVNAAALFVSFLVRKDWIAVAVLLHFAFCILHVVRKAPISESASEQNMWLQKFGAQIFGYILIFFLTLMLSTHYFVAVFQRF